MGPAGTGKTAMLAAAKASLDGQGRDLVVLAPTRKAAQVAAEELGARPARWPRSCTTTAGAGTTSGAIPVPSAPALTSPALASRALASRAWRLGLASRALASGPGVSGQPGPPSGRPYEGPGHSPRLSAGSVVVVDEAGLLSVDQAVALTEVARSAGAVLRLVGDPRQLGAVGRGGVMETAARWAPGGEVTLSQVHRFLRLQAGPDGLPLTVPDAGWADVCQQLREGAEPAGAAQALIERGAVVHQGRGEAVAAIAAEAAREAGREGALAVTAATNADARELNDAARGLRVAAGDVDDTVVATGMDGVRIGRGDRVVTRRNDNAAGVANREAWTVAAVRGDGSLVLKAKQRRVQLPAEYVAAAVQLGYAATDYGNQGVTATRSATWVSPATSAGGLYVGASRGRWENRLHVVAENVEEARDTLAGAVRRDRADRGLDAARAQAVAQSFPAPGKRKPGPAAVPEGWLSAAELAAALDSLDANLAAELARLRPVPVLDEDVWRSETETDRATAEAGRARWPGTRRKRAGLGQDRRKPWSKPGPTSSRPGRTTASWPPAPASSGGGERG